MRDRLSFAPVGVAVLVATLTLVVGCQRVATPDAIPVQTSMAASPFELDEKTIAQLQEDLSTGRYTSRRLVDLYLARIAQLDQAGPRLRSVLETNPDAVALADALDAERRQKGPRGPLHGIPILLKDNIDTGDRMLTTAGSLALADAPVARDAFVVARLRAAGAIILGKTNLSEWANIRSSRSTSGWSARGGLVKSPYVLNRNPCGSSSGTGSAIAANFAAAGVGTETDGSIICPSAVAALVGIKPTVGLVSRTGIIPISASQDTAGPMTRTVADAAAVLTAMAGADPADAATMGAPAPQDYLRALDASALRGARIGVARTLAASYRARTDAVLGQALAALRSGGAEIVDAIDIPTAARLGACEMDVLLYELKAGLDAYLSARQPLASVRSLADVIAFDERTRDQEMPHFGQELFIEAQAKGPLTDRRYQDARAECRRLAGPDGLDAVLTAHRLDAIVAPALGPAWLTDLVNGDPSVGAAYSPAAVAGYPSITVPAGWVGELPIGLVFMGRAWSEARLISLAYSFEQVSRQRRAPKFLPTLPFDDPLALD